MKWPPAVITAVIIQNKKKYFEIGVINWSGNQKFYKCLCVSQLIDALNKILEWETTTKVEFQNFPLRHWSHATRLNMNSETIQCSKCSFAKITMIHT